MDDSKYTSALLKPDAHVERKSELILDDIEKSGLHVIFKKDIIIPKALAKFIYIDAAMKSFYGASVKSLTGDESNNWCTLLVVKCDEGNARLKLQKIKGKSDEGGVRLKYRQHSYQQLVDIGLEGEELMNELAKNKLHVPDSDRLAIQLIFMLLNEAEIHDLGIREPELYQEIEREFEKYKELHEELMREYKLRREKKTEFPGLR